MVPILSVAMLFPGNESERRQRKQNPRESSKHKWTGSGGSPAVRFNGEATKRDRETQKLSHSSDKIPTRVAKLNFHDNI